MAITPTIDRRLRERTPRRVARHRVESLVYLDLGPDNGGFPINISEDGMDFQGVRALRKDQEISISLKLSASEEPVTARAKIVWLSESQKAGGLQFVDLPEAARKRIRDWIAAEEQAEVDRRNTILTASTSKTNLSAFPPATPMSAVPLTKSVPAPAEVPTFWLDPPKAIPAKPQVAAQDKARAPVEIAKAPTSSAEPKSPIAKAPAPQLQQKPAPQLPIPAKEILSVSYGKKQSRFNGYAIGAAAAIVAIAVIGALLWPQRESLLSRFDFLKPATSNVETGAAPAVTNSAQQPPATVPTGEAATDGATNATAIPTEQEVLPLKAPPIINSALVSGAGQTAPKAAQENRRTPAAVPARMKVDAPSAKPANEGAKVNLAAATAAKTIPATNRPPAAAASTPTSSTPALPAAAAANSTVAAANQLTPEAAPAKIAAPEPAPQPAPAAPTGTVEIIPDPYPSIRMPAEQGASASRQETSLQLGRLTSRVEPVYPPDALQRRIAGTVTVHVVISRSGTVQLAEIESGPAPLADAALRAVQQWRYEPAKLGGSPIEVEEEVKLVFRVGSPPTATK